MTDRITALEALIEKVEAGTCGPCDHRKAVGDPIWHCLLPVKRRTAWRAYSGSLDAAKALHDAVLCDIDPQYGYLVGPQYASIVHPSCVTVCDAQSNNPARAWLLAILRALLEQERALDALK